MGTHPRILNKNYPMNANVVGFKSFFQKVLHHCALEESSNGIGRINTPN